MLVHGTTVAVAGAGILIRGPSGSGKSDLALRLIDQGAALVADDQTMLARYGGGLVSSAPKALAGRLEVRGVGIVAMPAAGATPLRMIVDLVPPPEVERMPGARITTLLGVEIRCVRLDPREPAAPIKVRLALLNQNSGFTERS